MQAHGRGKADALRGQRLAAGPEDLPGRSGRDRRAVGVQGDDVVDGADELVQVVLDDEDRRAPLLEGGEERVEVRGSGRVEVGGRLIEHEQRRLDGEGRGEHDPLALPTAQLPGALPGQARHADRLEGGQGPRLDPRGRYPQILQGVADLVEDPRGHDLRVGVLHDHGDAAGQVGDVRVGHLPPGHEDAAAVVGGDRVRDESVESERDGGLATPGGAEQERRGPGGQRKRHPLGDPRPGAGVAHAHPVQAGERGRVPRAARPGAPSPLNGRRRHRVTPTPVRAKARLSSRQTATPAQHEAIERTMPRLT